MPRILRTAPVAFQGRLSAILRGLDRNVYLFGDEQCYDRSLERHYPVGAAWGRVRNHIVEYERVDRPNIRMNFDPINFERAGVESRTALDTVHAMVGHVHLKGLDHGEFCEFGAGDVDLTPVLRALESYGYRGGFSVEYEGSHDGTLRLYQSVKRAQSAVM
jgi:hypothetical protein